MLANVQEPNLKEFCLTILSNMNIQKVDRQEDMLDWFQRE